MATNWTMGDLEWPKLEKYTSFLFKGIPANTPPYWKF